MGQPVMQFQILSKNPDRTSDFYTRLFDWQVNSSNPLGYRQLDTGSKKGIQGGIWPAPPEGHGFVQLFVEVPDVAVYVEKAKSLGAQIIIPPQQLPAGEKMAVILDPEGIPLALFQPATA